MKKLAIKYGIEQNLIVKIDNTSPTLSSAHHEKIVVIDNKIGFCGGFDLSRGKWDTSKHRYNDPRRDQDSEPWHDLHAMIKGPIVWDLAYHFNQRWAYHEVKDEKRIRVMDLKPANFPHQVTDGGTRIVALLTWEGTDKDGGILAWYTNTIRKAKATIYIENQFRFQNEFITKILCKRLQEQKNLKVIVVAEPAYELVPERHRCRTAPDGRADRLDSPPGGTARRAVTTTRIRSARRRRVIHPPAPSARYMSITPSPVDEPGRSVLASPLKSPGLVTLRNWSHEVPTTAPAGLAHPPTPFPV